MNRNAILTIVGSILLIILIVSALVFEVKDVADYDWKDKTYLSEAPYGKRVFKDLIDVRFDEVIELSKKDTIVFDVLSPQKLYISLGDQLFYTGKNETNLIDFISAGNEAILIGKDMGFLTHDYHLPFYLRRSHFDSVVSVKFEDLGEGVLDSFTFKYYHEDMNKAEHTRFATVTHYKDDWDNTIAYISDSTEYEVGGFDHMASGLKHSVMGYEPLGAGCIYYHSMPELFYNFAALQSDYLGHFNAVFNRFSADEVIIQEPRYKSRPYESSYAAGSENLPLDYIFSDQSLKWTYFTLVFALALYVLFKGKRRQKVIPILPKNENTSLEFVNTLSHLFLDQKQHEKMVLHMRDIFQNWVRGRYFLDPNDENFAQKLAKKSKVPKQDIEVILNRFQNVEDRFEFNDDQLVRLSKRLDAFYKAAI